MRAIEATEVGDAALRGRDGPIAVQQIGNSDALTEAFIKACQGAGIPATADYNGAQYEGVGRLQTNTRRGRRHSAADGYLRPALRRPGLTVKTRAFTRRVIFEGRSAVGVEYVQDGTLRQARAGLGVVLAAGAIQSPQLLELSGIGDAERLRALGIPVVQDLPGVGENLSDHFHIRVTWKSRGVVTVNDLVNRPWLHGPVQMLRWQAFGTGLLAGISATAHALARSAPESTRPDIKLQLHKISAADRMSYTKGTGVDPFSGVSIGYFQLYPESRGSVHIASPDPEAAPRIHANYLTADADRTAAVRGLRLARTIGEQQALRRYFVEETRPGPAIVDEADLLAYARQAGQTSYHPVGTCRMGTGPDAVVDAQCRVRGVDGLRVIDASIMPFLVSSNTNAPAIAIGERGAALMLAESNTSKGEAA